MVFFLNISSSLKTRCLRRHHFFFFFSLFVKLRRHTPPHHLYVLSTSAWPGFSHFLHHFIIVLLYSHETNLYSYILSLLGQDSDLNRLSHVSCGEAEQKLPGKMWECPFFCWSLINDTCLCVKMSPDPRLSRCLKIQLRVRTDSERGSGGREGVRRRSWRRNDRHWGTSETQVQRYGEWWVLK